MVLESPFFFLCWLCASQPFDRPTGLLASQLAAIAMAPVIDLEHPLPAGLAGPLLLLVPHLYASPLGLYVSSQCTLQYMHIGAAKRWSRTYSGKSGWLNRLSQPSVQADCSIEMLQA